MKTLIKWSIEDYHRMIEAGIFNQRRVELREGEIIEVSPESPIHYMLGNRGSKYLEGLLHGLAYVRHGGPITLDRTERSPDIAIVKLPEAQYYQRHPYPEDIYWLIEIANSTLARDLNEKKDIYAEAGIQEYWVINVTKKQLRVFRSPQGNNYLIEQDYTQGYLSSLAFPDLNISVNKLLMVKI
ncbi:MAG TPA: hypothetical protein DCF68_21885 [Cyanothece sp. UBA12306]|nr:hypothetical protein [Cyanothece sp. UBA12306]